MIAWTSPLPISRSIPWRISWSGLGGGGDAQAADDELVVRGGGGRWRGGGRSVGHEGIKAPWRSSDRDRALGHQVGEGHRFEGAGDRVADANPQDVDGAARAAIADEGVLRVVGGADHRGDGPFEGTKDLAHPDLSGGPGQLVAAVGAARAGDEARVAEAHHELLEVGPRQVLVRGDLGEARGTGPEPTAQLDHQPDAVFALRAEGDGAASRGTTAGRDGRGAPGSADGSSMAGRASRHDAPNPE